MNTLTVVTIILSLASIGLTKNTRLWESTEAKQGEFPWVVNIFADSRLCVGTLLDNQWVLTTASCVRYVEMFRVRLGTTSLSLEDPTRVQILSRESYVHPAFNDFYLWHDIGLIKLSTPVEFNDYIKPIKLRNGERLGTDVKLTLYGWGLANDDDADPAFFLHYGDTITIDNQVCNDIMGGINTETVCSDRGVVTCFGGDEGAPATVLDENGELVVAAIYTTYVDPVFCDLPQKAPIRLARIEPYLPWIQEMTGLQF